jgi:hypothetical protein
VAGGPFHTCQAIEPRTRAPRAKRISLVP